MNAAILIRPQQLRAIHTLKGKAGLDDALYRDMLAGYGVSSSKALTAAQAGSLIESLKGRGPKNPRAVPMTGRYGGKIRALWIAGWNLGVVRDRTDEAACAFVERQTGVMRTAWLVEPGQGRAAIEALKSWLAREGQVEWPRGRADDALAQRRAVIVAQWRRLAELGVLFTGPDQVAGLVTIMATQLGRSLAGHADPSITPVELDAISRRLGQRVRKAASRQSVAA